MKLLLDTNAFLWQIQSPTGSKLGPQAKRLVETADTVYVSAISIVEMHIKTMLGKLDAPGNCVSAIQETGDQTLAFTPDAADTITTFVNLSRHDPFDRMLLAQARTEGLTFVTADEVLLGLGLGFVVDARQ